MTRSVFKAIRRRYMASFLRSLVSIVLAITPSSRAATAAPLLGVPRPSPRQLQWHSLEFYGLLHFGMNTFTGKEWGSGEESPDLFNPTAFDAGQIVGAAKSAGMKGLILVCKHHDGFCLWPSQYTEHSVKKSSWRNGKGDVVREFSDACRRQGLKFGVYASPWDRNHKDFGRPQYLAYYRNLLRELLTNYGDVFTVWFDGAQGGQGYYGGAREARHVDGRTYYDWPQLWSLVRSLQPNAVIFSDAGPDVRWVGNEAGIAGDPCWATLNAGGCYPGMPNYQFLNTGHRSGTNWAPAECDVPLRHLWFYHPGDDLRPKTPPQLVDIYYKSIGRGAALDLGLAPDKRGLLPEGDVALLAEMGRLLSATFATNLAATAKLTATSTCGNDKRYAPARLLDSDRATCWATDDGITNAEVLLEFDKPITFDVVRLREYLPLGQRVDAFALDQWQTSAAGKSTGEWRQFAAGTSVGNQRLLRVVPLTTTKVRLRLTQFSLSPALSEFGLYLQPPTLARSATGPMMGFGRQ